jgi:hypothetical protein
VYGEIESSGNISSNVSSLLGHIGMVSNSCSNSVFSCGVGW